MQERKEQDGSEKRYGGLLVVWLYAIHRAVRAHSSLTSRSRQLRLGIGCAGDRGNQYNVVVIQIDSTTRVCGSARLPAYNGLR